MQWWICCWDLRFQQRKQRRVHVQWRTMIQDCKEMHTRTATWTQVARTCRPGIQDSLSYLTILIQDCTSRQGMPRKQRQAGTRHCCSKFQRGKQRMRFVQRESKNDAQRRGCTGTRWLSPCSGCKSQLRTECTVQGQSETTFQANKAAHSLPAVSPAPETNKSQTDIEYRHSQRKHLRWS